MNVGKHFYVLVLWTYSKIVKVKVCHSWKTPDLVAKMYRCAPETQRWKKEQKCTWEQPEPSASRKHPLKTFPQVRDWNHSAKVKGKFRQTLIAQLYTTPWTQRLYYLPLCWLQMWTPDGNQGFRIYQEDHILTFLKWENQNNTPPSYLFTDFVTSLNGTYHLQKHYEKKAGQLELLQDDSHWEGGQVLE